MQCVLNPYLQSFFCHLELAFLEFIPQFPGLLKWFMFQSCVKWSILTEMTILSLDENNRAECVTVLELCISGMLWAIHLPRLAVHSSSQPIVLATFLTINTTTNLPAQLNFSVTDTSNQLPSISSLKFTFCACLHIQVQNYLKGHWLLETLNHENQFWLMSIYLFKISVC